MANIFDVDELRVYRGRPLKITDKLKIYQPTLGQIEGGEDDDAEGNERRFFSTVHTLIATPTDMMAQLDKLGLRYEELTNYQLFMLLFPHLEKADTRLLLGDDIDPQHFSMTLVENEDRIVLGSAEDGIVIDEIAYAAMVKYICSFMQTKQTEFIKSGNEFTRQIRMEVAYEELESSKGKKFESALLPLISTMVNMDGFKFGWDNVWDMTIGAFMDSVQRVQAIVSGKALLQGCYSGMVDTKKIDKKELNYLRRLV